MDLIRLRAGLLEVRLAPAIGGSIARFDHVSGVTRTSVMRGSDAPAVSTDCASFPLVPYSNRIRGGRFSFGGREIVQTPNAAPDRSPLHGQGWQRGWEVGIASAAEAELILLHEVGEWPWRYEARQRFKLDEGGLWHELSCRNLSDTPMPCGLGLHPYFPCTAETRLDTDVTHVWTIDEHVLPTARVPATGRYDLRDRAVCGQSLDHGFDGWSGVATITDPALPFTLRMTSVAPRFQLYSPPTGGLFVAEPVQAANAALNAPEADWAKLGLSLLEPGEQLMMNARFDVVPRQ